MIMRLLVIVGFSLCLLSAISPRAIAQDQNPEWIEVSPADESFHVSMPNQPRVEKESVGAVSGNRYVALTGVATYTIWSVRNINYRSSEDTDAYLDATAELLWERLLKPAREQLNGTDRLFAGMVYERELPPETRAAALPASAGLPGREYTLTVGQVTGTAEFFVGNEHIYILLAMGQPGGDWPREKFFASFRAPSPLAASVPAKPFENGGSVGPGTRASEVEDYNRIFTGKEVTAKVRVLAKPEPTYTESARKFGVQGTVVLRCVFSKDGQVTNLHAIRKVPHGLTQASIAAARAIRFTPAMKDGQPVSMWMELQYNFNLY
jgi:TonB family protein